jgi:hypothetical protein
MEHATRVAAGLAVLWLLALLTAPVAGSWSVAGGRAAAALVYVAGGALCHQRPERSFHALGRPLPVCARCVGVYAGGAAGLVLAAIRRPRRVASPSTYRRLLLVSAAPALATVALEWSHLAQPGNVVRAASAVPPAMVAGWMLATALETVRPPAIERRDGVN